jgi:hypothetical protein
MLSPIRSGHSWRGSLRALNTVGGGSFFSADRREPAGRSLRKKPLN